MTSSIVPIILPYLQIPMPCKCIKEGPPLPVVKTQLLIQSCLPKHHPQRLRPFVYLCDPNPQALSGSLQ